MTVGDFFVTYWFQFFVAISLIVVTILVNSYGEIDAKKKYNKFLPVLVMTVMWIIIRKVWINFLTHWKVPDIIYIFLMSIYVWLLFYLYYEKYNTQGFVTAEGCPASCYSTESVRIGKYTIFNCGSSNKTFRIEQGDFILVVPTKLIKWYGAVASCNVQVTRRDIFSLPYKLPVEVSNYILTEKNLNKNCIYLGLFDRTTLLYGKPFTIDGKTLTYKDFEEEFCNMNNRLNLLQEHADGRKTTLEMEGQHINRLSKAFKGKRKQFSVKTENPNQEEYGTE